MNRPTKHRRGARVVVVAGDEVLLLGDSDPGITDATWWVVPGGGIDPGEDTRTAAARELLEETGLRLDPDDLAGPVAHRRVVHGYSDRVLVQDEVFFVARVPKFEATSGGLTQRELARSHGSQWFPLGELPERVWPAEVATLAAWTGGPPLALGVVEESSFPAPDVLAQFSTAADEGDVPLAEQ